MQQDASSEGYMDFLSLAAVAAPLLALAAVVAEIVAKRPSVLRDLFRDSEAFARTPLVGPAPAAPREMVPANDQTRLAA
jgi:hypothetical protein